MLEEDIEEYLKSKAAESYGKGKKSIEAAAEEADVSVWTMIDYTQKTTSSLQQRKRKNLKKNTMKQRRLS